MKDRYDYEVSYYNINGDKDYQTNYKLAGEYFENVNAPYKEMFIMKDTTHGLLESKSEYFSAILHQIAEIEKQGKALPANAKEETVEENKIISALIGLVGACNNNPKTENTDRVVIKALAFSPTHAEADAETLQALLDEIHTEKYTIAPNCADCQTPCGNTSDYNMNRIYNAEADIRDLKFKMIAVLRELAADFYNGQKWDVLPAESVEIFYRALAYISFDMERDSLHKFWAETQETVEKIRRQMQE